MNAPILRNIYFVLNGKGGVGKSFFTTNLVQYLKDHVVACRVIDTDNEIDRGTIELERARGAIC